MQTILIISLLQKQNYGAPGRILIQKWKLIKLHFEHNQKMTRETNFLICNY